MFCFYRRNLFFLSLCVRSIFHHLVINIRVHIDKSGNGGWKRLSRPLLLVPFRRDRGQMFELSTILSLSRSNFWVVSVSAAQQLKIFSYMKFFSCKFQEHQNFQSRSYFSALTNVCIFVLERKKFFCTNERNYVSSYLNEKLVFIDDTSQQLCLHFVAFIFASLFFATHTSHINNSIRSHRKNLIHLILIARYEVLAKSHTSHTNSSVRSPRKNPIHLILIARYEALAKIPYTSY
jgi:hypothetical protein